MSGRLSGFQRLVLICSGLIAGALGGVVSNADEAGATNPTLPIVPSPGRPLGVSCATTSSCMAVGLLQSMSGSEITDQTLAESWNGTNWSNVPSPNPSASDSELTNVSCPSTRSCMAVGSFSNYGYDTQPLAESWNGTSWSIVPAPDPTSADFNDNYFEAVSCSSSTSCMAVGVMQGAQPGIPAYSFIEVWNGRVWSYAPDPVSPANSQVFITKVSCSNPSNCMALGSSDTFNYGGDLSSLIFESWNGTAWSIVPSPSVSGELIAISWQTPAAV
jgi:hypothetical protein